MFFSRNKKFVGETILDKDKDKDSQLQFNSIRKFAYLFLILCPTYLTYLFFSGNLVIFDVPSSIILKFIGDSEAVTAYFNGDGRKVHDRLRDMQIEKDIKDFYRKDIPNEIELDRYIHQLLYDRTGYVGIDYEISSNNQLILRKVKNKPSMTYK